MDSAPFTSLVEPRQLPQVFTAIERAVTTSFQEDRQPGRIILVHALPRVTVAEQRHRVGLCIRIFRELRGDLKWSLERIADHLARFLRCELDGVSWRSQAEGNRSWLAPGT